MSTITPQMIKELREKAGAGIADCKKALEENDGDFTKAEDWLKQKGLSLASKKADRVAAEGLVAVKINDNSGVIIEVNSETDFVARNQEFVDFVARVAEIAVDKNSLEEVKNSPYNGKAVNDELLELIARIRENLVLRKFEKITSTKGRLFTYTHQQIATGIGRIAVILNLEGENLAIENEAGFEDLGKKLCMHIAAFAPKALSRDAISQEIVDREKSIQAAIVAESNKPQDIQAKMLDGKMNKFFQEVCLLEQAYLMDDTKSVAEILKANKAGILNYTLVRLGEGIEKETSDFASEVQKVMQG